MQADGARMAAFKPILPVYLIFERPYEFAWGVDLPVICPPVDPATNLDRHFHMEFDLRFVQVQPVGPVPPLGDEIRRRLQNGLPDTDFLGDLLPADKFVLRGFMILKAIDVTDQEVLSSLKRDLIDKESIVSNTRFQSLQAKI